MDNPNSSHVTEDDNVVLNDYVEQLLTQMNPYIIGTVGKEMRGNSFRSHPALLDLEIDEVVQRIRVKFWLAWQKGHVEKPVAYLKRIIHNEIAEFARTYEPFIPLPLDKHGELRHGQMILTFDEDIQDIRQRYYTIDAREKLSERNVLTIVKAILYLPDQQRYALMYKLHSEIDNIFYFTAALQDFGIDLQRTVWPQTPQEKKRVRASYTTAKRTLSSIMGNKRCDRMKNAREWVRRQELRRSWTDIDIRAKEKVEPIREVTHLLCHLEDLKEPYQTALRLHYLEQRSYSDIATSLNLPVGTVKAQVQRGLEGTRQLVEGMVIKRYVKPTRQEQSEHLKFLLEIKARVSDLKEPYRTSVYLRYVEGKSCTDIATQLNLPSSTIKSRVSRGLRILGICLPD